MSKDDKPERKTLKRRTVIQASTIAGGLLGIPPAMGSTDSDETTDSEPDESDRSATDYTGTGTFSVTSPEEIASALGANDFFAAVDSVELSGSQAQVEVFGDSIQGFPRDGDEFVALSSGNASEIDDPNESLSGYVGGEYVWNGTPDGYASRDTVTVTLDFVVPEDAETLEFGYKFGTDELPTWAGSAYQDYFTAVFESGGVSENVALLPDGDPVTVDNVRPYADAPEPNDTGFNRVSELFTASVDVTPYQGQRASLRLRVGDATDTALDSGALIDGVTFNTPSVPLRQLAEEKIDLVQQIRGTVPPEYLLRDQIIDLEPERFAGRVKANSAEYSTSEKEQYGEALERLTAAENVTKSVTDEAVSEIIPRSSGIVIGAVATIAIDQVSSLASGGVIDDAKQFLVGRTTRRAKSVKDATVASDELGDEAASKVARDTADAEREYGDVYERVMRRNGASVQAVTDKVVNFGIDQLTESQEKAAELYGQLPSGFREDVERITDRFTDAIEGVFFQYYWAQADPTDFEFSLPQIDLPDEIGYTVDIPSPADEIPGVPDEISASVDVPDEKLEGAINDYVDRFNEITELVDLASEGYTATGIEPVLTEGTEYLDERAGNGSLDEQPEDVRSKAQSVSTGIASATTDIATIALDLVNAISFLTLGVTVAVLFLAVATIMAFFVRTIVTLSATLLASNYLAAVPTILAKLGVVDLVLVGINFVTLGLYLSLTSKAHYAGATTIFTAGGREVASK